MQPVDECAKFAWGHQFLEFRVAACASEFKELRFRRYQRKALLAPCPVNQVRWGASSDQGANQYIAVKDDAQSSARPARVLDRLADDSLQLRVADTGGPPLHALDRFLEDLRAKRFFDQPRQVRAPRATAPKV